MFGHWSLFIVLNRENKNTTSFYGSESSRCAAVVGMRSHLLWSPWTQGSSSPGVKPSELHWGGWRALSVVWEEAEDCWPPLEETCISTQWKYLSQSSKTTSKNELKKFYTLGSVGVAALCLLLQFECSYKRFPRTVLILQNTLYN